MRQGEYAETDATDPQSVYGRSKLEGEQAVAAANPRHVILRTAWVYSPFGRNFVKTMLGLASQRDHVRVVADQWGNPTSAADIADGILRIAKDDRRRPAGGPLRDIPPCRARAARAGPDLRDRCSRTSGRLGGPSAEVEEIATADYPTRARRPQNSRLSCEKLLAVYGWRPPAWQESCAAVVARLVGAG